MKPRYLLFIHRERKNSPPLSACTAESDRFRTMTFHVKLWHLLVTALLLVEMVAQTLRNFLYLHTDLTGGLIGIALSSSALALFLWVFLTRRS